MPPKAVSLPLQLQPVFITRYKELQQRIVEAATLVKLKDAEIEQLKKVIEQLKKKDASVMKTQNPSRAGLGQGVFVNPSVFLPK